MPLSEMEEAFEADEDAAPGGIQMNQLEQQEQDHWAAESDKIDNIRREQ